MAKARSAEELAERVFLYVIGGIALQIAAIVTITLLTG